MSIDRREFFKIAGLGMGGVVFTRCAEKLQLKPFPVEDFFRGNGNIAPGAETSVSVNQANLENLVLDVKSEMEKRGIDADTRLAFELVSGENRQPVVMALKHREQSEDIERFYFVTGVDSKGVRYVPVGQGDKMDFIPVVINTKVDDQLATLGKADFLSLSDGANPTLRIVYIENGKFKYEDPFSGNIVTLPDDDPTVGRVFTRFEARPQETPQPTETQHPTQTAEPTKKVEVIDPEEARLKLLQELAQKQGLTNVKFGFREVNEGGKVRKVAYVYENSNQEGDERVYFVGKRDDEDFLMASPDIPGMVREISDDGSGIYYINPQDGKRIVTANIKFPSNQFKNNNIYIMAGQLAYGAEQAGVPRDAHEKGLIKYWLEGVNADFYGIHNLDSERVLSLQQSFLLILKDEYLKPFWKFVGDDTRKEDRQNEVYFVTGKETKISARYGYGYTALFPLFFTNKNTSNNTVEGSSMLLHEKVAHSNPATNKFSGPIVEIGNRKIPPDFNKWTPEQLLEALAKGEIGAYHLNLWAAYYWKLPANEVKMWIKVIKNRTSLGPQY